jgi:hypothetical protein
LASQSLISSALGEGIDWISRNNVSALATSVRFFVSGFPVYFYLVSSLLASSFLPYAQIIFCLYCELAQVLSGASRNKKGGAALAAHDNQQHQQQPCGAFQLPTILFQRLADSLHYRIIIWLPDRFPLLQNRRATLFSLQTGV